MGERELIRHQKQLQRSTVHIKPKVEDKRPMQWQLKLGENITTTVLGFCTKHLIPSISMTHVSCIWYKFVEPLGSFSFQWLFSSFHFAEALELSKIYKTNDHKILYYKFKLLVNDMVMSKPNGKDRWYFPFSKFLTWP